MGDWAFPSDLTENSMGDPIQVEFRQLPLIWSRQERIADLFDVECAGLPDARAARGQDWQVDSYGSIRMRPWGL
jgi:hypothetical protein